MSEPLTQEQLEVLTKDLQEVLEKHGAEMGVTSTITLMKSQIPSPYATASGEEEKGEEDQANPEAEKGSAADNGKSAE